METTPNLNSARFVNPLVHDGATLILHSPVYPEITMDFSELEPGLFIYTCPKSGGVWIPFQSYLRWKERRRDSFYTCDPLPEVAFKIWTHLIVQLSGSNSFKCPVCFACLGHRQTEWMCCQYDCLNQSFATLSVFPLFREAAPNSCVKGTSITCGFPRIL
jgi:hypothetical protein